MQEGQQSPNTSPDAPWQFNPDGQSAAPLNSQPAQPQQPAPQPQQPPQQYQPPAPQPQADSGGISSAYAPIPTGPMAPAHHTIDDDDDFQDVDPMESNELFVAWTASEYISHQKSNNWFILLGIVTLVVSLLTFVLTRNLVSTGFVITAGIMFAVFASRKPSIIHYEIHEHGIVMGQKYYPFQLFRSFAVMQQGGVLYAELMPVKRLMPSYSMFFSDADAEKVLDVLSEFLPNEQRNPTLIDQFMHLIRF